MTYKLKPPSDKKIFEDGKGLKFSARDMSVVDSSVNAKSSLIKFGEEIYNKYLGSGYLFFDYERQGIGKGYIVYSIENEYIRVLDVYTDCINPKETLNAHESLIETVYNISKSLNKDLFIDFEGEKLETYINHVNNSKKEQKIEDIYLWKKELKSQKPAQ